MGQTKHKPLRMRFSYVPCQKLQLTFGTYVFQNRTLLCTSKIQILKFLNVDSFYKLF